MPYGERPLIWPLLLAIGCEQKSPAPPAPPPAQNATASAEGPAVRAQPALTVTVDGERRDIAAAFAWRSPTGFSAREN